MSTLVTLILIPTLYRWAHRMRSARSERKSALKSPTTVASVFWIGILTTALATTSVVRAEATAAPGTLTPDVAIQRAFDHHPRVDRARRAVLSAESKLREMEGAFKPRLALSGGWETRGFSDDPQEDVVHRAVVRLNAEETFLTGPSLGRDNTALKEAESAVRIARMELEDEKNTVAVNVLTAYTQVLKAHLALAAGQKALERANHVVERVDVQKSLGMAGDYDVLQAEVQKASAENTVASSRRRLEIARARLNDMVGLPATYDGDLTEDGWPFSDLSEDDPGESVEDWVERAQRRRLEIVRASIQLEDAYRAARRRTPDNRPVTTLTGSVMGTDARAEVRWSSRDRNTTVSASGDVYTYGDQQASSGGSAARPGWSVNVQLDWPLYDGGKEHEVGLQEQYRLEQLESTLDEQRQTVALDVKDAYYAWLDARERLRFAAIEEEVARERLHQVQARADAGVETPLGVFEAEYALLQAERDRYEARWDVTLAWVRFLKAQGVFVWAGKDDGDTGERS